MDDRAFVSLIQWIFTRGFLVFFIGGGLLLGFLARYLRREASGSRFAEFESGERCMGCDSTRVVVDGDQVSCRACGYETTLSAIRKEEVGADEVY